MRATGDAPPAQSRWQASRQSLRSHVLARRHASVLRDIETYCLFIGHARGGGSMLGALLDAHPEAVIADEADVLGPLQAGWSRDRILAGLIASSRSQARRRHAPRASERPLPNPVPGQWQGRFERLRVIGSSQAGPTTRLAAARPGLLRLWRSALGDVRLRVIHVVRNPYDAISQMIMRSGRSFESGIERYESNCHAVMRVRAELEPDEILLVRYEALVDDPARWLHRACEHLGLAASDGYLEAAASTVGDRAVHRGDLGWQAEHIEAVGHLLSSYPFLKGYSYSDHEEDAAGRRVDERVDIEPR